MNEFSKIKRIPFQTKFTNNNNNKGYEKIRILLYFRD